MDKEELEVASKMVKPIYASAVFKVSRSSIIYMLVFDYIDPAGYYKRVVSSEDLEREELEKLANNMQRFLDEEDTMINGSPTRPEVMHVDIGFRGDQGRPFVSFIIYIDAEIRRGVNVYENRYEPDVFEYDYTAYWVFPKYSKILEVIMGGNIAIANNIIVIRGSKGDIASGYEKIRFETM